MGRMSSESQQTVTHFSHPHPMKLINSHQTLNPCSGCKLAPSGIIYSCTLCSFFLHKNCFEMPQKITHPFHKAHAFTLLPEPAYAEGVYGCDACGETGSGFSYHCKPCGIDLHILCAATPLSLTTAYHPHKLDLAFASPYHTKNFVCGICKGHGSDHWLYRCNSCGFDVHLKCAARSAPPVAPPPKQAATYSRVVQQNFTPHPMMNNAAAVGIPAGGPVSPPFRGTRQNEMTIQAIMQMIQNNNAMSQAILAGSLGGIGGGAAGRFGGNSQQQQLMQLISGISNGGFGGGGIPGLDALGGGGLDSLQSLLGGGGGLDFLGGGGLDVLGGLF